MKIGIACRYEYKSQPTRSLIHSETLSDMLKTAIPGAVAPTVGDGSLASPYVPSTLSHWYYLALQRPGVDPSFILVSGFLIARWGTGGGQYVNYCTDVTDFVDIITDKCIGQVDYEDAIRNDIGDWYKLYDSLSGRDSSLPSYTRKAQRVEDMDDRQAALICRNLIENNGDCNECPELACSLCSLLISEAHRTPETFVISLMLLDLIETGTTYGQGGLKTYTWKSMLMYGIDGIDIPGRGNGMKALGKHPMVGTGTVAMGAQLHCFEARSNIVKDRVISIMAVWLAHYMAKNHSGFTFFIVKMDGHQPWTAPRQPEMDGGSKGLRGNCFKAVKARCQSSALLIGGTTVLYEDLEGNPA